ncbi:MAG: glycosyltransferase family 4 protein [Actinomycetota bacterium]|nr:glycosyltransferase family 4 protein [Actinomycetota bacterium]
MRVLLTHPYGWPHVRRGAERELHELAAHLVRSGVSAGILTGTPHGVTSRGRVDGVPVRYVRSPSRPGWEAPGPVFAAVAALGTLGPADLVHCLHYTDAYGVSRLGRHPVVLKMTGTVRPEALRGMDGRLVHGALARADEVWCNSEWAAGQMAGFGVPMRVVPAGLDTTVFRPVGSRSERPLVVCAAAAGAPRKRVVDLLDAWPSVVRALPGARLVFAGQDPPASLPAGATYVGPLADQALAALYARAWVVVAPAVYEALGLVTLEALACGTPVAGVLSGATPSLVPAGTGALAAPMDPASLAVAVVEAAGLSQRHGTVQRCREAAAAFGWERVVPTVVEGYRRVLQQRG